MALILALGVIRGILVLKGVIKPTLNLLISNLSLALATPLG
ncbi:hypothetical protein JCM19237_2425 [Photobacterium aphoticum]|uniref:Uncharacterized protein n=1 Tax=Photobacterium aphoticum TaxID=754436 RepID=A0A090QR22_9GAMM|nr:hypothetical protein JCM19237_2425 [Photobacterium aphoticum]